MSFCLLHYGLVFLNDCHFILSHTQIQKASVAPIWSFQSVFLFVWILDLFFFLFMSVMQERNTGYAAWLQFSQEYDLSSAVHLSSQILDFLHSSSSRFRVLRRLFFWLPPSFRCARFISRLPAASVVRLIITAGKKGSAELLSVEWPIDYITDEKLRRGWRCGAAGSDAASGSCLPVWSFS